MSFVHKMTTKQITGNISACIVIDVYIVSLCTSDSHTVSLTKQGCSIVTLSVFNPFSVQSSEHFNPRPSFPGERYIHFFHCDRDCH